MKKILLISDLHQQNYILKNLENLFKKEKFEGIIVAGDLTNRAPDALDYAKRFEKIIKENSLKLFFVPGNLDSDEVVKYFEKKGYSIHLKEKNLEGFRIIGIGGFGENYPKRIDVTDSIFVTHIPPIISNKIFKDAPKIHIFGHLHFWEYQKKHGKTILVQLKAAILNRAAILEIPSLKVSFVSFKK